VNLATDLTVIIQALKQEVDVMENYEKLYRRCYPQVYLFFIRKNIAPEDANDLTQNTFFSVFRNLKTLRQDDQFESWLFQIARHELYHQLEKQQAQKRKGIPVSFENDSEAESEEIASPSARLSASDPNPQELLLEKESRQRVHAALQQLPEQMRRVAELRVNGLEYHEIAQRLGISINTVKSQLFQARERLRKRLGEYFGELNL
jgi:RNA polymerase sigma-70 factor, ECF subfamily